MADLESSLRSFVLQSGAVSSSIGARFHWDNIPDNESYPCVRAVTVTHPLNRTHNGTHGGRSLVQLDVYSDAKGTCNAAAETIRLATDNYKGAMGDYAVTMQVKNAGRGSFEPDSRLFRRLMEIEILYSTI